MVRVLLLQIPRDDSISLGQAAQATFKSIRSVVPLLDRILVQRFKPDVVSQSSCQALSQTY